MYTVCLIFWYLSSVNSCLVSSINGLRIVFLSGTAFWLSVFWVRGIQDGRLFVRGPVYGHAITKFSGIDRFSYPRCSATQASRARELRYDRSDAFTCGTSFKPFLPFFELWCLRLLRASLSVSAPFEGCLSISVWVCYSTFLVSSFFFFLIGFYSSFHWEQAVRSKRPRRKKK